MTISRAGSVLARGAPAHPRRCESWSSVHPSTGRSPGFAPLFTARGRAMCPNQGAIHHGDARRIRAGDKSGKDLPPEATLAPAVEPVEFAGSWPLEHFPIHPDRM